jgi:hypothetical protein
VILLLPIEDLSNRQEFVGESIPDEFPKAPYSLDINSYSLDAQVRSNA